jgi:hypothetical protein
MPASFRRVVLRRLEGESHLDTVTAQGEGASGAERSLLDSRRSDR